MTKYPFWGIILYGRFPMGIRKPNPTAPDPPVMPCILVRSSYAYMPNLQNPAASVSKFYFLKVLKDFVLQSIVISASQPAKYAIGNCKTEFPITFKYTRGNCETNVSQLILSNEEMKSST